MECKAEAIEKNNRQAGFVISFPWGLPGLDYYEFTLSLLEEGSVPDALQVAGGLLVVSTLAPADGRLRSSARATSPSCRARSMRAPV